MKIVSYFEQETMKISICQKNMIKIKSHLYIGIRQKYLGLLLSMDSFKDFNIGQKYTT